MPANTKLQPVASKNAINTLFLVKPFHTTILKKNIKNKLNNIIGNANIYNL